MTEQILQLIKDIFKKPSGFLYWPSLLTHNINSGTAGSLKDCTNSGKEKVYGKSVTYDYPGVWVEANLNLSRAKVIALVTAVEGREKFYTTFLSWWFPL